MPFVNQFPNLQLSDTSNQIVLCGTSVNSGTQTTINANAPAASLTYTIPDVANSCNFKLGVSSVITPAAGASSLTAAQSGAVVMLSTATSGNQITLPPVATSAGVQYKFILATATAGANCTVTCASGSTIRGILIINAALVACPGKSAINVVSGTAIQGDNFDLTCNGSSWFVNGFGSAAGSLTTTA